MRGHKKLMVGRYDIDSLCGKVSHLDVFIYKCDTQLCIVGYVSDAFACVYAVVWRRERLICYWLCDRVK